MKKHILLLILGITISLNAQELKVPIVIQEQTDWCWAAVSKCVLDYYGHSKQQCEIAEYTRSVSTWHNYGTTPCCTDASQGCNYENYLYGRAGSIQDILEHFGDIGSNGDAVVLSISDIRYSFSLQRPFIVRFNSLIGKDPHFVVASGINDNDEIFYMDPDFGYGFFPEPYETFKNNGNDVWTHTLVLLDSPIPDDCFNCKKDEDEDDIDCGGPCPPCQHAKNVVNYNYNTSNLPEVTGAYESITAGDADVHVLAGQNVTFITNGYIVLKSGFKVEQGANFKAEHKSVRKDVGVPCGTCVPDPRPNRFCRNIHTHFGWELAGITQAQVSIYRPEYNWELIHSEVVPVDKNGFVAFWDLHEGAPTLVGNWEQFFYMVTLITCEGNPVVSADWLLVHANCQ